jgi:hypothetical protein
MTASASRSAANRNRRHLPACGGQTASRLSRLERIKKQKSAATPGQFSMHLPDQRWMNIDTSGSRDLPQTRLGGTVLASSGRIKENSPLAYDGASESLVAAN